MLSIFRRKEHFTYVSMWASKFLVVLLFLSFVSIASRGQTFVQQGSKLVATDASVNAEQGRHVGISGDGNTVVVGSQADNNFTDAATIYVRNNGTWSQQGPKLIGNDISPTPSRGESYMGTSVDISADGNTIVMGGARDNNNIGAVWVFKRSNGIWVQDGPKLVGSGFAGRSAQGAATAISGDGNTIVVGGNTDGLVGGGSPTVGAIWVFTRKNGIWTQQGNKLVGITSTAYPNTGNGWAVDISYDGNTIISGAPGANFSQGAAIIFKRAGETWAQQGNELVGSGSSGSSVQQGFAVAISSDGKTAAVGGPFDSPSSIISGAAWIFSESGTIWTQQSSKLMISGLIGDALYGFSVSLSGDGNMVVIGGRNEDGFKGGVRILKRSNGTWLPFESKLVGTGFIGVPSQGQSVGVSMDGRTIISGGYSDNNFTGAVWVFNQQPIIRINDISVNEDAGTAQLQVCLSEPTNQPVTVQYAPSHGSAKADSDYVAVSGTLTIPAGQNCVTIPVTIIDDTLTEGNEDAVFRIFNATNATISDAYGAINIKANDKPLPRISMVDVSYPESWLAEIPFCIGPIDQPVTVSYRTRSKTALGGVDYVDTSGTATLLPGGNFCGRIYVRILKDTLNDEPTEDFEVIISNPVNALLTADSISTVSILNIDESLTINITDATVNENAGPATLFISITKPMPFPLTVGYTTIPVSATPGLDYPAVSGQVIIPAGQTSAMAAIPINDDLISESTESFNVFLNSYGGAGGNPISFGDPYGAVNIIDNDGKGPQPGIKITKTKLVKEGVNSNVDLDVCLTNPHSETVTVEYVTTNGSATAGTDYTYAQSFVRIYPGATCATISIPVKDDQVLEGNETFTVRLINPANGTIVTTDAIATISIADNDSIVCPAGAICVKNTCPSTTVNLNTAYSIPLLPAGTVVSWHTGTPATDANRISTSQAQAISTSASYYAAIYTGTSGCYSATLQVVVNIISCGTNAPFGQNTTATNKESVAAEKTIIPATSVAPNPFNNGFNVVIHADKSTEAVVTLIDIYGRQVQTQKVVLNTGKNNLAINTATKMPPGNYFMKIKAGERNEVHKLVKQ